MGYSFRLTAKVLLCTIPQTGLHIPQPLLHQSWNTGWNEKQLNGSMKDRSNDTLHHEQTLLPRSYISLHINIHTYIYIYIYIYIYTYTHTYIIYILFFSFFLFKTQLSEHLHPNVHLKIYSYYGPKRMRNSKLLAQHDVVLTTYSTVASDFKVCV